MKFLIETWPGQPIHTWFFISFHIVILNIWYTILCLSINYGDGLSYQIPILKLTFNVYLVMKLIAKSIHINLELSNGDRSDLIINEHFFFYNWTTRFTACDVYDSEMEHMFLLSMSWNSPIIFQCLFYVDSRQNWQNQFESLTNWSCIDTGMAKSKKNRLWYNYDAVNF